MKYPPILLSILSHPDSGRIGDIARLPEDGSAQKVSRTEPGFADESGVMRALDDPFVSRSGALFTPAEGGGLTVDTRDGGVSVSVDGRPIDVLVFPAVDVAQGLILTLNDRVALYVRHGEPARDSGGHGLLGRSLPMTELRRRIDALKTSNTPLLIVGEAGSGRESAARALHRAGPSAGGPFVVADLSRLGLSELETLVEQTGDGTLYFIGLSESSAELQAQLDHVLAQNDPDVSAPSPRFMAAASPDEQRSGWELVRCPTLRERPEDIAVLFVEFLSQALDNEDRARLLGDHAESETPPIAPALVERLLAYTWPGNASELREVTGEIVLRSRAASQLYWQSALEMPSSRLKATPADNPRLRSESEVSDDELLTTVRALGGDHKASARALGVSRGTLARLVSRHPELD